MGTQPFLNRMRKELADFERDPPPLITCYPSEDDITQLEAYLNGPPNTPYEKGIFRLDVTMPETYPFDPPVIRFRTPIYHPNIDECGRICASVLKKGKEDQWKPSMNLRTTLLSLHALIGAPNPDDPLDADIAREYQQDYDLFVKKARDHTKRHAIDTPDNLIPDPFINSRTLATSTTNPADTDFDNHSDAPDRIFSSATEDTSVTTTSKSNNKNKLSLSMKKQSAIQSTTFSSSSSQHSTENDVKLILTEATDSNSPLNPPQNEAASTRQQSDNENDVSSSNDSRGDQTQQTLTKCEQDLEDEKDDVADHSSFSGPDLGSRNKTTKYDNEPKDNKDDAVERLRLGNLEKRSRTKDVQHEMESSDSTEKSILNSNHGDEAYGNDIEYEDRPTEEHHTSNQQKEVNACSDITKQVIWIDLDNEPSDQGELIHGKTTCVENAKQQTPIDVDIESSDDGSNSVDQVAHKGGMDEICDNTTKQLQLASVSSPAHKVSNPTAKESAVTAPPLTLTSSTDKALSPSLALDSDDKYHLMDTASPSQPPPSPLRTVTVDDTADWTYTNHYSSHHLTFATNDPFAEAFPTFDEEEEERPITPKRKLKVSLSCKKKKPKVT